MNAWLVSGEAAWRLAGWTMLHFLWVGAAVALVGGALRVACRRAWPGVRYGVSLVTLGALAVAPVGIVWKLGVQSFGSDGPSTAGALGELESRRDSSTWGERDQRSRLFEEGAPQVIDLARTPVVVEQGADAQRSDGSEIAALDPSRVDDSMNPSPSPSLRGRGISLEAVASYLPWVWLLGAPGTFALLATGLVGSRRLRRQCAAVTEGAAIEALERIRKAMRVARRVALGVCEGVVQPVLVGIVRPTILLPAAALTGWSPQELEMVLVHELAHVRRWDNLVNFVQRLVESALFFHPAVWLASRQVRRDREESCDAAVVAYTRQPAEYAELLVAIAGRRARGPWGQAPRLAGAGLGSALADHPLAGRIRRILKLEDEPMWVSRSTLGLAIVLGASLLAAVLALPPTGGAVADDASSPPSPVAAATDGGEEEAQNRARSVRIEVGEAVGERSEAPARVTNQSSAEDELRKLKNDIAHYQAEILELQKEQERNRTSTIAALQNSQSPKTEKLLKQIKQYQQHVVDLQVQVLELKAGGVDAHDDALRSLEAQKQDVIYELRNALEAYKQLAEKEHRSPSESIEASRSAMAEHQILAKSLANRKAELEAKLEAAEARIAEMAERGGEAPARWVERTATTYVNAAGPDFELAQAQEKIRTYQQALLAQRKEAVDLEVQKQMAEVQAQRAASIDAQVERELSKDRRANAFEQDAIALEQKMRAMRGEADAENREQYERAQAQYEALLADAEKYRQETAEKFRTRYEKLAKEMADESRQEFEIKVKAIEKQRAELAKELKEAEARWAELAKQAAAERASAGAQNPYYYSTQPRLTAETVPAANATPIWNQPREPAAMAAPVDPSSAQPQNAPNLGPYAAPRATRRAAADVFAEPATPVEPSRPSPAQNVPTAPAAGQNSPLNPLMEPIAPAGQRRLQPYDLIRVQAAGVFPDQPLADEFRVEEEGTVPLGPTYGRAKVAGLTVLAAQEAIERKLEEVVQDAEVQVVLAAPATSPAAVGRTHLLYDGKGFDEWAGLWQNELKTQKRQEAIEALAAFGRAGMAMEASEAILEVAAQYDFFAIDNQTSEGQLKQQVIELLTSTRSSRLPESAWLPALVRRMEAEPARWKWLAWHLLNALVTEDSAVRDQLFELAKSQDDEIKKSAVWALANSDPKRTNAKVTEAVLEMLLSSDAEEVKSGIHLLVSSPVLPGGQRFAQPNLRHALDVAPLAFHEDESVRQAAREALACVTPADAPAMVEELLARLKKAKDETTTLEAIRALAAMGRAAKGAEAAMRDMIAGGDRKAALAATVALNRMFPEASAGSQALTDISADPTTGVVPFDAPELERELIKLFPSRGDGMGDYGRGGGRRNKSF